MVRQYNQSLLKGLAIPFPVYFDRQGEINVGQAAPPAEPVGEDADPTYRFSVVAPSFTGDAS